MPLNTPIDTRVAPGSNEAPDYAKQVTDRLASEYVGLSNTMAELIAEVPNLPRPVKSDEDALMVGALIKRMRDLDSRIEAVRVLEKEPYLRGGNAVDALLNGWRDQLAKRNRNDRKAKDGWTDTLQSDINVFQDQKIAEERARRAAEAAEAERRLAEAAKAERAAAAAAEAARLAAERARKPEHIETKTAAATIQEAQKARAAELAAQAEQAADEARLATYAKPADLARVRGTAAAGGGVTLTVAQEPYAELIDRSKVDMEMLRPFFTDAEIEKALRGWAKTTGHRTQMPGAAIGFRNRGVTR